MKWLGNVLTGIGLTGMILGLAGYDSAPVYCAIIALVGIILLGIGYELSHQFVDREEVIGSEIQRNRHGKTGSGGLHKRNI